MSTTRKKLNLNTVSIKLGCSCRRLKLSFLFHPKPKPKSTTTTYQKHSADHLYSNYSSSSTTFSSETWDDSDSDNDDKKMKKTKKNKTVRGFGRVGGESVAVEKDSDDPYLDFRHSMLQMILEKEIYSKDDLKELLNCFLQLNSPYHHDIILTAFTEIWNGVFSVNSSSSSSKLHLGCKSRDF